MYCQSTTRRGDSFRNRSVFTVQTYTVLAIYRIPLHPDGVDIVYMGLGEGYQHLKSVYSKLSSFVEPRLACEMIDISQQEIDTWHKQQAEALKQYPELAQILIAHQKHNQ